jgi:hypothetical protein
LTGLASNVEPQKQELTLSGYALTSALIDTAHAYNGTSIAASRLK